jgi:hypothetical protein
MSVKLLGRLPKDENNGLASLAQVIDENPLQTFTIVATIVAARRTADYDHPDDPVIYGLRMATCEPLTGDAARDAMRLAEDAFHVRTGLSRLPFDGPQDGEADDGAADG